MSELCKFIVKSTYSIDESLFLLNVPTVSSNSLLSMYEMRGSRRLFFLQLYFHQSQPNCYTRFANAAGPPIICEIREAFPKL